MIVAETDDRFRFVTQTAHAALAGRFADAWGNDAFDRPAVPAIVAAHEHDDGWWAYDRRPRLDGEGEPIDFREVPAGEWIDIYDRGIEVVRGLDPHAGLLVSMHGTGLRRRRYGLSPSWPDAPPGYASFVDRHEGRQERWGEELRAAGRLSDADLTLLRGLHGSGGPPDDTGSRLWFEYALLQAWDALSLAFCTAEAPDRAEVGPVPTGVGGAEETLSIRRVDEDAFRVEPYPFETSPLAASVSHRTVGKGSFEGEDGLLRAYFEAGRETAELSLRGGDR